ncbi:MAG: hypothetical protein ACO1TE_04820 [Prosthecobacter sp.]
MKTHLLRLLSCALLGCLLTACPETTVSDDFGIKPAALKAGEWNGEWVSVDDDEDEVVQITAIDATRGILRMTEPGKKDDKPVDFEIRRASLDGKAELLFALVNEQKDKEQASQPTVHLIRAADDGVLLVWSPNHEAIAKGIQTGQLKGTTKLAKGDPQNHLASESSNYTAMLEPQYWNWAEPSILKRKK